MINTNCSPNNGSQNQIWFQHTRSPGCIFKMEAVLNEDKIQLVFYINDEQVNLGSLTPSEPISHLVEMWQDFVCEMNGELESAHGVANELCKEFADEHVTWMELYTIFTCAGKIPAWAARIVATDIRPDGR